jgi:hypothetical protein
MSYRPFAVTIHPYHHPSDFEFVTLLKTERDHANGSRSAHPTPALVARSQAGLILGREEGELNPDF